MFSTSFLERTLFVDSYSMDIVRNVTSRWKVVSWMMTSVFIIYLASSPAAESSLIPFSSQQVQNYSSHFGLKTLENDDVMETERQVGHLSLVERGVSSSRKASPKERESLEVNAHEGESWSDQASSVLETTSSIPSWNIRGKRDATSDTTSVNSIETSSDSQQTTETTLLVTTSQSSETTLTSVPTGVLQSTSPSQEPTTTLQPPQTSTTGTTTRAAATTATDTTVQPDNSTTMDCPNVSGITIDEVGDGDIAIHWTLEPPGVRPQNVCVEVTSVRSGACRNHEQCSDPAVQFKTVSNLCHFNEYEISVSIQCVSGLWEKKTSSYTTKTSLPSQPTDFEDTDVTNTTIALKWSPPSNPNGNIAQYTVYCELCHSRSSNITETSYMLQNLQPYTDYNVSVSAWTSAGESKKKAGPLIIRTKDGIPGTPENLTIREFSNETLILEWSPPSVSKGAIGNFSVYWKESVSPGNYQSYVTRKTTHKLENLKPYTNYTLKVSAWTSAGEGPTSEEITEQTKEGIPDSPENLRILEVSDETLILEWSPPSVSKGVIGNFSVYWKESLSTGLYQSYVTTKTTHKLENLKPYTNYALKVSARTSAGEGQASEEITQQTKEGIPDPPENLRILEVSGETLILEWSPPSVSKGVIGNFSVYWKESLSSGIYQSYVTTKTTHKLENLKPYTNYTFKVSSWTSAGEGQASEEITQQTKEGIPDSPENLRILEVSGETLILEWAPPSVSKGVIGNFSVYWKESLSTGLYQSYVTTKTTHKLENLKPYTNYTLKVSARTSAGEGQASEEITQQTKEGIPGPPLDLNILNGTDSSLTLKWSPPDEKNGVILKYEVSWSHTANGNRVDKNTNTTSQVFLQIDDLYPYINYTFTVSAFTVAGRGPPSNGKRYQTDVGVPSKPTNVSVSFTGRNALSLSWGKPVQPRGPIDGYIVSWQETSQPPMTKQIFDTKSGEAETHEIKKLIPFTNYTISVASYNVNRPKQVLKSEDSTTQAQTSEGIPSAPEGIVIAVFTNTTFSVRWQAPETPNGIVKVYTVYCNSVEDEGDIAPVNITGTKYTVSDLLPFTTYSLSVSATTIAGEGSRSKWITHKTDVGVPSAPANVSIVNTTDTSIYVEWIKPEFQRGLIDGFHIYCRKIPDDVGNVAGTEHHQDYFNITVVEFCEDYNTISTKAYGDFNATVTICHYQFSDLDPWTNYTIEIKAYNKNQHGDILQGPPEVIKQATLAAVPESPILRSVDVLSSTSVSVYFLYEGRYPGPTSYAVELETDGSYSCNSYDKRNYTVQVERGGTYIPGLMPYTGYYFRVFASTEAGSSYSHNRSHVRTMPDAPGKPRNIKANCHDSPTKASLSWETPYIENGLIEKYKIKYRPKSGGSNYMEEVKKIDQPKLCNIREEHHFELRNLHPETDYEIAVMAKTKDVSNYGKSESYPQSCVLPAGVPPFPKNFTLPEDRRTSQEEVKLTFSKNTFSPEMGEIRYYAVIVAFWDKIGIATNGNMTQARDEKLPFWNEFRERNSEFYQATPEYWNPFEGIDYDPLHCQRDSGSEEELLYCTIGWEKNCSSEQSTYCNGPLIPGKRYGIKLRGFTRGGYSETNPVFIETAAIPHKSQVGIIVGLLFLFLLILLVAGAILLDRRNNFKTLNRMKNLLMKKEASSTEQNADIDLNRMGASGSAAKTRPMDFQSFLEHVKLMMSDSFLRFSLEYEEIKQNSPRHPCTAAEMEENRMKNRWMNIFPFDHSRVKLLPIDDEPSSDYINANYIPGFSTHREYIATQGPLPSTIDDFWRMVWEQSVTMIVMLTQCVERGKRKCEQYWPVDCDNVYYGDLKIQLKSESILSGYCIRIFDLQLGSRQRTVKQMHFTKWPDFGSPESPQDLINFAQAVRDHLPHTNTGPIAVHCSAGVGRTGTFIAVDRLLQYIQFHNDINIYNTVVEMREHRTNMVQTEDQYIYIHKCLRDIISERLHPRTSIYDDDNDDDDLYSNIGAQQATEL